MAINNKGLYKDWKPGFRIEGAKGDPIVTTDEVAVEIQKGVYDFGSEIATCFTSLTNHYCSKCYSSQVIS